MGFRCRLEKYRENEDLLRKVKWKFQGNAVCKRLHQTKPLRVSSLKRQPANAYAFATKATAEKQIVVKAHERKRQSSNVLDVVPEGTRTEVVEHRLPENEWICAACGSELVEIGRDVRRTLQMKPAEFWVREDVYYTYACKNCEQETGEANIVKAAKAPALLSGSGLSGNAEVCHVLPAVPAGTGIQSSGLEAVPADDGQLAAERLGEMAAAGLRCAA